jgi:ribosome maturation factor RimP
LDFISLESVVSSAVSAVNCRFYHMSISRGGPSDVLRVYIDSDSGVSLQDCGRVNKHLRLELSNYDAYSNYSIEVSSPGIERQLYKTSHYEDVVGSKIKIKYTTDGINITLIGVLDRVEEGRVFIESDDKGSLEINFTDIIKSSLFVEV